ncbi:MAG: sigma-70 family RNA polymerase sigma factor [Clostridia bacterium]|nr:sigma-70 family RNA polymerase sigma factor [Clostridia bacterium]
MSNNINIIEQNIGLVKSCVSKFLFKNSDYDDIFQAGCLGLTRAAKKFNPEFGTKFSSYAVPFILGEIKNFFNNNNKIKLSRNNQKIYKIINTEREEFCIKNNREPTLHELSEKLNIPVENILEALESHQNIISIEENNLTCEKKSNIFEESHEKYINTKIDIRNAINKLSNIDKKIINMRFFESKTQSDSAKILGMTQVQISRREKKILKNLRNCLSNN